jgi:dTDP-4-amino-4,6-dideoxygalactose transaminase
MISPHQAQKSVSELALFGGTPAFAEKLHVGKPNVGNRERLLARINDMLDRRWFSNNGLYVQEFERKLAEYVGVKHCIPMCNATIALEIATRAAGLSGEVIVPSFTFVATAHSLQWQEITPVFCDVDPRTHNIDPARVEELITPRTTGIVAVHLWGQGCDVEALQQIADRRGLKLIFDAAHAFGCTHKGHMIGNNGLCEIFSFHATKFLNSFEGGAVATNDDELAAKIRLMKNFGFAGYDTVIYIGTNGKMNEASAAMGLTSLESIDEFICTNQRNHAQYRRELSGLRGLRVLEYNPRERSNFQYVVLEIDEHEAGISRDLLVKILWAENVMARRYFYPGCHRMEPYCSYFPHAGLLLPVTEHLTNNVMILPNGTTIGEAEVAGVCDVIHTALSDPAAVHGLLERSLG